LGDFVLETSDEELHLEVLIHGYVSGDPVILVVVYCGNSLGHIVGFSSHIEFEGLNIFSKYAKMVSPDFWVRSWRLSQTVFVECFGSKGLRKLSFTVAQSSLSVWKTSRLSHQDWARPQRMLANSWPFLLLSQVAIPAAI
jgi:hypothetical protein